jgi:hypothetical protein
MNQYKTFHHNDWWELYKHLDRIDDLWIAPKIENGLPTIPWDLSTVPLNMFISPGSKSTVLIRLPSVTPHPDNMGDRFWAYLSPSPRHKWRFSNALSPYELETGHGNRLFWRNWREPASMNKSVYTFTQSWKEVIAVGEPGRSIIGSARGARKILLARL